MAVFDEICELPPEARSARLDALCAGDAALRQDVESLLAADVEDHRLVRSAESGMSLERIADGIDFPCDMSDTALRQIGAYQIVREIGRGGMGIIYEARQESPSRRVALKVLRPGLIEREMLKRFQHEAHVLGQLQHSGIAQIFEAGVAETAMGPQPFLVMELIEGEPLDIAAKKNDLNMRQRLELLARVCDAVQHAHQKGVIHRDLKPSNVLVTIGEEKTSTRTTTSGAGHSSFYDAIGQPKVLDFGIARVTDSDMQTVTVQTEVGQLVGTLAYMSPEQVEERSADLDTRCDVYALGVMLYELMADRRPHDLAGLPVVEAARRIREQVPVRLGAIDRRFRGDVETIVAKALEHDRERRYGSAAELAADIRRYLEYQPIEARPASMLYQFGKFAKRNKGFVGGVAAAFATLIVGLGVTAKLLVEVTKQKNDAVAARKEADSARDAANDVTEFQLDQLAAIDVPKMGEKLRTYLLDNAPGTDRESLKRLLEEVNFTDMALATLEQNIFERSVRVIDEEFTKRPLIQARLFQAVSSTQRRLGLLRQAVQPQMRTVEIRREILGNEDIETLRAIGQLSGLLVELGRFDDAEPLIQETLDTGRRTLGENNEYVQTWLSNQIALLFGKEQYDDALPLLQESLEIQKKTLGEDSEDVRITMGNLASILIKLDRQDEALPYVREILASRERTLGKDDPKTLHATSNLAAVLRRQGKLEEAESVYRTEVETRRRVQGDDHPMTLFAINNLASVLFRLKRYDEAEPLYREAIEASRSVVGPDHPETVRAVENLGTLLITRGDFDAGLQLHRDALASRRRLSGDLDPDTLLEINFIADSLARKGRVAESIPLYTEVVNGARKVFGSHHPSTIGVAQSLIDALSAEGRFADAEAWCRLVVEAIPASTDGGRASVLATEQLGVNLLRQSKFAEAATVLESCVAANRKIVGDDHWRTLNAMSLLGEALANDPERRAEGVSMLNRAYEGLRAQGEQIEALAEKVEQANARRLRYAVEGQASSADADKE